MKTMLVRKVASRAVWALINKAQEYATGRNENYNAGFKAVMQEMQTDEMKNAIANFIKAVGLRDCCFNFKGAADSADAKLYQWAMTYC